MTGQARSWIVAAAVAGLLLGGAAAAWAVPVGTPSSKEAAAENPGGRKTEVIPVEPILEKAPEKAAAAATQVPPTPAVVPQVSPPKPDAVYASPRIDLAKYFPEWAHWEVHGNALWQLLAAIVFLVLGLVAKKVSDFVFRRKIARLGGENAAESDSHVLVRSLSKPLGFLFVIVGLGGAVGVLSLPAAPINLQGFAAAALKVLLVADLVWFLFRAVDVGTLYLTRLSGETRSKLDDRMVPVVRKSLKVVIAVVCAVWVVQLLDYSVSGLIAGLGIGGLAMALALQDTLANFFGSVFIFLDRPFRIGDHVRIADVEGTVEDIGLRSTRIRTLPETLVSIPNKTVAAVTIDNLSKMPSRRVLQTVGVGLKTTPEQMEQAVAALREILAADEGVAKQGTIVRFADLTAANLGITVQYFTRATDLAGHLAAKERINLAILRKLRDLGVTLA